MERRIFGLENEYGVTCTLRGQRRLSPDEVARYLFRRVVSWGRSSNVFLQNGARLYLDVGSHPEHWRGWWCARGGQHAWDASGGKQARALQPFVNIFDVPLKRPIQVAVRDGCLWAE